MLYAQHLIVLRPSEVPADGCLIVGDNRDFHVWLLPFCSASTLPMKAPTKVPRHRPINKNAAPVPTLHASGAPPFIAHWAVEMPIAA